jgi:hypothetical protein
VFGWIGLIAVVYIIYALTNRLPIGVDIQIAIKITNLCIDAGCALHYLLVLVLHPVLGKELRRSSQLIQFWRKNSISAIPPPVPRKVIACQDTEIYFKDLNDAWNK